MDKTNKRSKSLQGARMSSTLNVNIDTFFYFFTNQYTSRFLPHLEMFHSKSPTHSFQVNVKSTMLSTKKVSAVDYKNVAKTFAEEFFKKYFKQLQTFDMNKVSPEEFKKEYSDMVHTSIQTISTISKKPLNTKDHWVQGDLPENKIILIKSFNAIIYIQDITIQLINNDLVVKATIELDKKLYEQTNAVNIYELQE